MTQEEAVQTVSKTKKARKSPKKRIRQPARTPILSEEEVGVLTFGESTDYPSLDSVLEPTGPLPITYNDLHPGTIFRRTPDSPAEKKPWTNRELESGIDPETGNLWFPAVDFIAPRDMQVQMSKAKYFLPAGQRIRIPSVIAEIAMESIQADASRIVPSPDGRGAMYNGVDGLHVMGTGFPNPEE